MFNSLLVELQQKYNILDEDIIKLEKCFIDSLDIRIKDTTDELLEQIPTLINNIKTEYPFKNDEYINGYIDGIETLEYNIKNI